MAKNDPFFTTFDQVSGEKKEGEILLFIHVILHKFKKKKKFEKRALFLLASAQNIC